MNQQPIAYYSFIFSDTRKGIFKITLYFFFGLVNSLLVTRIGNYSIRLTCHKISFYQFLFQKRDVRYQSIV